MPLRALLSAALLMGVSLAPALALGQEYGSLGQRGEPPRKHSILVIYGDDACPESVDGELVVCAQEPESERYRVPKELREEIKEETVTSGSSWGSRVEGYDDIARVTRPDSCSAVGTYGASGCAAAASRQWQAERRAIGSK